MLKKQKGLIMYKHVKKAPAGAHYHKVDSNDYYRVEKGILKEWHGNHWEVSFFNMDMIEDLIYMGDVKPLYINILINFLVAVVKISLVLVSFAVIAS